MAGPFPINQKGVKLYMDAPSEALQIRGAITAGVAFCTALWGSVGWMVVLFMLSMLLDYVTGSWSAIKRGEWSSSVARQGLWHKVGEIIALMVAALSDIALRVIFNSTAGQFIQDFKVPNATFTLLVSTWYIFTELGSIVENIDKLGAPIPKWLKKSIAKIRDNTDPNIGVKK